MNLARVFVSRQAGVSPQQSQTYERFLTVLAAHHLAAVELPRQDYEAVPWAQLRRLLGGVAGVAGLGFVCVTEGRETPWTHLEAGLALMPELPVLAAAEEGISRGIFDADVWRGEVHGTHLPEPDEHIVGNWAKAVYARAGYWTADRRRVHVRYTTSVNYVYSQAPHEHRDRGELPGDDHGSSRRSHENRGRRARASTPRWSADDA